MGVGGVKGRSTVVSIRNDMPSLAVPRLEQPTGYECGNTSIAAVARFFGRPTTTAEVARLARTRSIGTDHQNMIEAATELGARVHAQAGGTIADLAASIANGVPPIVGWWSMEPRDRHFRRRNRRLRRKTDCGHYSVVTEVTDAEVILMDPQEGPRERFTHAEFLRVWYDTDTDRYVKVSRWFLAMSLL